MAGFLDEVYSFDWENDGGDEEYDEVGDDAGAECGFYCEGLGACGEYVGGVGGGGN